MWQEIKQFLKREYKTLNKIEISRKALVSNYRYLKSLNSKVKIAPVLKSNAYGHGIKEVGKILDPLKPPFFCVDSLYEAYNLKKAHIKTPILIMGYTDPANLKIKPLNFNFAVWDLETVRVLDKYQPDCKIHLFVDTGMNREGVPLKQLPKFLVEIKKYRNIEIVGLMSHLASSNSPQDPLFKLQVKNFKLAKKILQKHQVKVRWFHLSASDVICNPKTRKVISQVTNLVRPGIATYGVWPDPNLKPVLKFTSTIATIKQLDKDSKVGYDGSFTAKTQLVQAIIPAGYNDGVDRRLSNKGFFLVKDILCPIIGRVSMNITNINISKVDGPKIGDEVVILSNDPADKNSVLNIAQDLKTVPHEVLIHLHPSTKRLVVA